MDENQFTQDPGDYRTGRTNPPKSRRGPMSAVLMAAILLTGVFTAVRILEIPLFFGGEKPGENAIRFSVAEKAAPKSQQEESFGLGIGIQNLSDFDRYYYQLPAGVYITYVAPGSDGARKGLAVGDVLTAVDGIAVDSAEKLQKILYGKKTGDTVKIAIYRNGKTYALHVVLDKAK